MGGLETKVALLAIIIHKSPAKDTLALYLLHNKDSRKLRGLVHTGSISACFLLLSFPSRPECVENSSVHAVHITTETPCNQALFLFGAAPHAPLQGGTLLPRELVFDDDLLELPLDHVELERVCTTVSNPGDEKGHHSYVCRYALHERKLMPLTTNVVYFLAMVQTNKTEVVRQILAAPEHVDVSAPEEESESTALHYAVECDFWEMMEILIEHKADVNARDREGFTPLHFAAVEGHRVRQSLKGCQLLVDAGADPSLRDCLDGGKMTPMEWAKTEGHTKVVTFFSELNAKLQKKRKEKEPEKSSATSGKGDKKEQNGVRSGDTRHKEKSDDEASVQETSEPNEQEPQRQSTNEEPKKAADKPSKEKKGKSSKDASSSAESSVEASSDGSSSEDDLSTDSTESNKGDGEITARLKPIAVALKAEGLDISSQFPLNIAAKHSGATTQHPLLLSALDMPLLVNGNAVLQQYIAKKIKNGALQSREQVQVKLFKLWNRQQSAFWSSDAVRRLEDDPKFLLDLNRNRHAMQDRARKQKQRELAAPPRKKQRQEAPPPQLETHDREALAATPNTVELEQGKSDLPPVPQPLKGNFFESQSEISNRITSLCRARCLTEVAADTPEFADCDRSMQSQRVNGSTRARQLKLARAWEITNVSVQEQYKFEPVVGRKREVFFYDLPAKLLHFVKYGLSVPHAVLPEFGRLLPFAVFPTRCLPFHASQLFCLRCEVKTGHALTLNRNSDISWLDPCMLTATSNETTYYSSIYTKHHSTWAPVFAVSKESQVLLRHLLQYEQVPSNALSPLLLCKLPECSDVFATDTAYRKSVLYYKSGRFLCVTEAIPVFGLHLVAVAADYQQNAFVLLQHNQQTYVALKQFCEETVAK
eukprot:TRINITY_DN1083_c0_g1_i6.p1 TRINITY_DN1083_c0_g1~~TRINITY_DN1083_c0_g1_i6.p1  ORF type:complete len:939 (-),score=189.86 TRINITY_DN1083_c0_g1_i6:285-2918(-)